MLEIQVLQEQKPVQKRPVHWSSAFAIRAMGSFKAHIKRLILAQVLMWVSESVVQKCCCPHSPSLPRTVCHRDVYPLVGFGFRAVYFYINWINVNLSLG